ncbi:MAG: hypothetical protein ACKV2T_28715 [Kofleriaceae bacterium]
MRRAVLLVSLALASTARATPFRLAGGHVNYGIGGGTGAPSGAWHFVDLGVATGWLVSEANRDGLFETDSGLILTGSIVSGLGTYPTFVNIGVGQGISGILGGSATLDLVTRVDPDPTMGLGVHLTADLVGIQSTFRIMVVGLDTQLVAMWTVGFGRF